MRSIASVLKGMQSKYSRLRPGSTDPAIQIAIKAAEREGQLLALKVRTSALSLLALWLALFAPSLEILYPLVLTVLLILLGLLPLLLRRAGFERAWLPYALVFLDSAFLALALFVPNPLVQEHFPLAIYLRFDWFVYFFVLLAFYALSYSPSLVLLSGISGAAAWSLGVWFLASLPGTRPFAPLTAGPDFDVSARLEAILDPAFIDVNKWEQQVVVLVLVAIVLAAAVWRSRQLVAIQATAERARTNLARYFSPNLVDEIVASNRGLDLDSVRQQKVAVLFADIVGFTTLSESLTPLRVVKFLRGFHRRMANAVFAHNGTIDKYSGDSVMATFGTPHADDSDASRAIACALEMVAQIDRWNEKRQSRGDVPIKIGIGVHYGEVVVGNIGDERRLEYTVIGDTVNVASRLERLTRELDAIVAISDNLINAARASSPKAQGHLMGFERQPDVTEIPGRSLPITIWTFRRDARSARHPTRSATLDAN